MVGGLTGEHCIDAYHGKYDAGCTNGGQTGCEDAGCQNGDNDGYPYCEGFEYALVIDEIERIGVNKQVKPACMKKGIGKVGPPRGCTTVSHNSGIDAKAMQREQYYQNIKRNFFFLSSNHFFFILCMITLALWGVM